MYLRVASPNPVGRRLFCHMAENKGRGAEIMLGPAQTSIQLEKFNPHRARFLLS